MAAPAGRESDPLIGYQFRIEIDGPVEVTGYFTEVSGIGSEHEVVEQPLTDEQGTSIIQKMPGRLKWEDVVLKRGITADLGIWDWRQKVEEGQMDQARANCSVVMMDTNGQDVARWDLVNAWPSKVTGPTPKSDSNEYGIEEMNVVHEGMTRVS
jgi:phage tail-like protein